MTDFKELEKQKIYASQGEPLTAAQIESAINVLHSSPTGKSIIAAQTKGEIKRELLYEGRFRKIFDTYQLTQGEEAVFDADVDVPAVAISPEGIPGTIEVKSDRLRIDTSVIGTNMVVRWDEAQLRKFDMLEASRKRALASIQLREDIKGYTLLKYATDTYATSGQTPVRSLAGTTAANNNAYVYNELSDRLSVVSIADCIGELRSKLLPAGAMLVNPKRLTDLLLFNVAVMGGNLTTSGGFGIFAPTMQEEFFKKGQLGEMFGVPVFDSVVIPMKEAYVVAPKEYLGKLAIRADVQVESISDPRIFGDVYAVFENIAFVARYVKGITRIEI